ncbi:MAG: DASH family cryptochrome [Gammaproteobacteria bacterium]|nr:DASH family cryptochrome [Gammaproteobacteria bacterium]
MKTLSNNTPARNTLAAKTLYWVTRDLRLDDNIALSIAAQSESLLIACCVDPRWFSPIRYQLPSAGIHRWNFIQESLSDLNNSLLNLNQQLLVYYERPELKLVQLIRDHRIQRLVCCRQFGWDEIQILASIQKQLPDLTIEQVDSTTVFDLQQLPFAPGEIPQTYSRFRRAVENLPVTSPRPAPDSLPPPVIEIPGSLTRPDWVPDAQATACPFRGGETEALQHLQQYFSGNLPLHYKEVRNELAGWDNSSKMSPWLNNGCLSPRRLKTVLDNYEQTQQRNESTYWLWVELLWREYFQWLALQLGTRLFTLQGTAERRPLRCFHPDRYQAWCNGNTPYPLVNACMRELATTGYLSNRGRQIAASCFINELQLDWRYGAAWFEHQLVDYDVAANWSNWQYIAGVGADPRGGRHFNLEKQTDIYDPRGNYRDLWTSSEDLLPLDSRDAADWPIIPSS